VNNLIEFLILFIGWIIPIAVIIGLPLLTLVVTNYLHLIAPIQIILTAIAGLSSIAILRVWIQKLAEANNPDL
jgi:hypothetical protein